PGGGGLPSRAPGAGSCPDTANAASRRPRTPPPDSDASSGPASWSSKSNSSSARPLPPAAGPPAACPPKSNWRNSSASAARPCAWARGSSSATAWGARSAARAPSPSPAPGVPRLQLAESRFLGYLQMDYQTAQGQEEAASRAISGLMLQGAIEEAGASGFKVVIQHVPYGQLRQGFAQLSEHTHLRGVIFASCGDEKLLRRVVGLGLPTVLLDHDIRLPGTNSVRDDSFGGARHAVAYLASLGHRRIAIAHWHQAELNPWRMQGYRQGLKDAHLPRRRVWEFPTQLTEDGAPPPGETWLR